MNDTSPHAASPADAQKPKASELKSTELKSTELKSKDTGVLSNIKARADTATPQPKADELATRKPAGEKPAHASSAVKEPHADSSEAELQDGDDGKTSVSAWKKRLSRAEEKGRKLGRAEFLDELRATRAPEKQAEKPAETDASQGKTLADFDYDMERFTDHLVERKLQAKEADQDKKRTEAAAREARTAFEKRKADFETRAGEGAYEDMVSAEVDVPQEVVDLLMGHERDLDIAHYLVHHTAELDALKGKSKLHIARELAVIEGKLSPSKAAEGKERESGLPPKTTKAPPPPPNISGGKSAKSIAEMSTSERIAEWRRQKQSRRPSAS